MPPDVNQVINTFLTDLGLEPADEDDDGASSTNSNSSSTVTAAVAAVRFALAQIPRCNVAVLQRLARLLRAVVAHRRTNLMTRNNLFIVLIPTLRCAPSLLALAIMCPDELFLPS